VIKRGTAARLGLRLPPLWPSGFLTTPGELTDGQLAIIKQRFLAAVKTGKVGIV
jgi:hypothetical protein